MSPTAANLVRFDVSQFLKFLRALGSAHQLERKAVSLIIDHRRSTSLMKAVTVILLDFDNLSRSSDQHVIQRMVFACRMSRKALLPRNLNYNFARVSHQPHLITIHLLLVDPQTSKEREVALFRFAPAPDFSRVPVML